MSVVQSTQWIDYPETDGEPMGETDLHIEAIFRMRDILRYRYRDQRVYVASNMFIYYVDGAQRRVAPDNFVVKNCDPSISRRVCKTWEEGRTPDVVFEITKEGQYGKIHPDGDGFLWCESLGIKLL